MCAFVLSNPDKNQARNRKNSRGKMAKSAVAIDVAEYCSCRHFFATLVLPGLLSATVIAIVISAT